MADVENSTVERPESNSQPTRLPVWIIIFSLLVAGAVLSMVVSIGIRRHNDRLLSAQLIQSKGELQTTGAMIAGIKDHRFKTMGQRVRVREPRLNDDDHKLQAYADLLCQGSTKR